MLSFIAQRMQNDIVYERTEIDKRCKSESKQPQDLFRLINILLFSQFTSRFVALCD